MIYVYHYGMIYESYYRMILVQNNYRIECFTKLIIGNYGIEKERYRFA